MAKIDLAQLKVREAKLGQLLSNSPCPGLDIGRA